MRAIPRSAGWAFALLAVLSAAAAWACSCLPYPDDPIEAVQRAWDQSDAVLSGTVSGQSAISADGASPGIEVTFAVARRWKGPEGTQLKLRTADSSAACGYPFENGAQYLVFASRDPETGQYSTGLCSLTRPLADARALVRVLDARVESK